MAYNTGSAPTQAQLITAKFIPEMFSAEALMHTMSRLVCVNCFNTSYRNELKKGYKVSIPVFSEGTAADVTPGTEPTAQDLKGTAASITIDNWKEASAELSDMIEVQQHADYLDGAAKSNGYTIQKSVDTSVGVLFSTLNASSVYGADGQTFTDDIFKSLVETLDEGDVPDDDRCLIGDPSMKRDLLSIDKFMRVDYVREPVVPAGKFGQLYGAQVFITNNLTDAGTGNYGTYAHRDAIGIVMQKDLRSRIWDMGYKFITKVITDAFWGADVIRTGFGISFYTRSD